YALHLRKRNVGEVDAERRNLLREQSVRDLVEAGFLAEHAAIFADERCAYSNKTGHGVFVLDLPDDDGVVAFRDGVHRNDAHTRGFHVLRAPIVKEAKVPPQLIQENYLPWKVLNQGPKDD